jgi:hypothetical protein
MTNPINVLSVIDLEHVTGGNGTATLCGIDVPAANVFTSRLPGDSRVKMLADLAREGYAATSCPTGNGYVFVSEGRTSNHAVIVPNRR